MKWSWWFSVVVFWVLCFHGFQVRGEASLPVAVTPTAAWKAIQPSSAGGDSGVVYGIDYQGSGWPALLLSSSLKANAYYRITWKMKGNQAEKDTPFIVMKTETGLVYSDSYVLSPEWTSYTFYFYSGDQAALKARLYLNPGPARQIQAKEIFIQELPEADLYEELLPCGDMEVASNPPVQWIKAYTTKTNPASVVATSDFISGSRSMKIDFVPQEKGDSGICSIHMPVIAGKTGELRFWAKSETETSVTVWVDTWFAPHEGKHYYKAERIKISSDWKEYVVCLAIPSTFDECPDVKARMALIRVNGQPGTVYFDGLSFKNVK